MGVGCDALASGCQIVHAAQARIVNIRSLNVYCLELFAVLLVEESNGYAIGSAQCWVVKGKHSTFFEEAYATQKEDLGLLVVSTRSVEVFAAAQAEEQSRDQERHRDSIQRTL